MTSKKGKRTPRKTPEPLLTVAQTYQEPEIVCPHCEQEFLPTQLKGKFLDRSCPCCGKEIFPEDFDDEASPLAKRATMLLEALKSYRHKTKVLQEKIDVCEQWWKAPRKWMLCLQQSVRRKIRAPKMENQSIEYEQVKKQLRDLAKYRYYVSEWFACTHVGLSDKGGPLGAHYCIETGKHGVFPVSNREGAVGTFGEMTVFNLFLQEMQKSSSVLQSAYLLPNLYIPLPSDELREGRSFWSQIDLVVLTRQCAFIIEVKNWGSHVFVEKETGKIYSSKQWGAVAALYPKK